VKTGESNPKTLVDCIINFNDVGVGDNKILPMVITNEGGETVFTSITESLLPFTLDTNVYSGFADRNRSTRTKNIMNCWIIGVMDCCQMSNRNSRWNLENKNFIAKNEKV